ncbi:hypothetical protein, partial [Maribacter aurantiacus]
MKRLSILSLVLSMVASVAMAQIKIGDNPQTLDPSSLLELESNSRVLVISKVSTAQMEAIAPQRGGMVYNTDTECVHYFNGAQWVNLCDAVSFTITNDPIENLRSTIAITQTQGNYNLEVATNSIRTEQIADGGINGVDIQDNSIGRNKLGDAAVGPDELATESVDSDAIIDGTILPRDIGSSVPNHVLATDINGTVLWQDQNDLFELSFDKDTNTLAIVPSTGLGSNSINLEALVGSDDQTLTLTPDNRLQIENGNEIDLSFFNNAGTDNQTLSLTGNVLAITGGNTVSLVDYVNTDNQQLSITGNRIELTDGGFVDLPPGTVDTDEQDLSLAGTILNISRGTGVDLAPILGDTNTDNQDLSLTGNTLNITGGTGIDLTPILGGTNTDEQDLSLAGTTLNITNGTGVDLAPILGDANTDNQNLSLTGNTLNITGGTGVDLTPILGGTQNATQVPFTPTGNTISDNVQAAIVELQSEIDGISAGGTANPNDELITSFALNGTGLDIAEGANALPTVDLDGTFVTEAELTNAIAVSETADGDRSATNEIQDLDLTTDILTITNNGAATPIDLSPYLDNTDAQTATLVPVATTPANYTAGAANVEAHLVGIDAALAGGFTDTDDQNIDEFQISGANILSISLADDGAPPSTVNLTPYLDNTDAQTATLVPVAATPANYTAGAANVEAHLVGIDAALAGGFT